MSGAASGAVVQCQISSGGWYAGSSSRPPSIERHQQFSSMDQGFSFATGTGIPCSAA